MYELRTIVIDDFVVWASVDQSVRLYVGHAGDYSHSFARWQHFDVVLTGSI